MNKDWLQQEIEKINEYDKGYDEGYKQGVREFANFLKSFMGIERDCVGIKYKQGVFSDYEIDDLVEEFNNRGEEN